MRLSFLTRPLQAAFALALATVVGGTMLGAQGCSSSAPQDEAPAGEESSITGACDQHGAAALAWEAAHLHNAQGYDNGNGHGCWSDQCGLFVYKAASVGANFVPAWLDLPANTADDMMHNAMNAGVLHNWDGSCPCGAILFYKAHGSITTGHVVLCNGDGTVSSSGWPGWPGSGSCGFNGDTHVSIDWMSQAEGIPPTGYVVYGGTASPPSSNACTHVSSGNNGEYCGSSTQSGFGGGSPLELYDCQNGQIAGTTSCQFGCRVAPAGQADGCYADPCAGVPAGGNGQYCGASNQGGFKGSNPKVVYDCQNGHTASTSVCKGNCVVAPAGQADHC
jgi:hypothetical protein